MINGTTRVPRRAGRRPWAAALRAVLAALLVTTPAWAAEPPALPLPSAGYHLGRGYRVAPLGLMLGGYANLRYSDVDGERANLTAQDLSLFVGGALAPTWRFFSESEIGNAFTVTRDSASLDDADFDVERLYVEHDLRPEVRVRVGKFLTPVGRWNLIHAAPLVWSVSRPLTTAAAFSRHAAGAELIGSLPAGRGALDYRLFADDTADLDPTQRSEYAFMDVAVQPNPRNAFEHAAGVRLLYRSVDDHLEIGVSAAHFRLQERPHGKTLVGADLIYARDGVELSGEAVYRDSHGDEAGDDYGAFLQLVLPLPHHLYAVASHERYRSGLFSQAADIDRFGLTYRPVPPVSLKIERRETRGAEQLAPDGWLAALSLLL